MDKETLLIIFSLLMESISLMSIAYLLIGDDNEDLSPSGGGYQPTKRHEDSDKKSCPPPKEE